MRHPYSGAASYIYANERLSGDENERNNNQDHSPYSHMRSLMPVSHEMTLICGRHCHPLLIRQMHSLITLQPQPHPWPPQNDMLSVHASEPKIPISGSEDGLTRNSRTCRSRTRITVWRRTLIKRRIRNACKSVGSMFSVRLTFPLFSFSPVVE
ncbi:hypothetical protein L208DRAFT_852172 [Tricholoma matsutake]|nr:hypothetical protein L208DRAFT_852172 [Tricholoma matsutake 945]